MPAALAKLDKLEVLDVSENRFAEFPAVIGELRALRELRACAAERGPSLTKLPEAIGDLRNLEVLELFNHKLTALPASIAKLTKLRELRISSTRIAELPESIATLPSLEEVWLPSTAKNASAIATALKKRNVKVA